MNFSHNYSPWYSHQEIICFFFNFLNSNVADFQLFDSQNIPVQKLFCFREKQNCGKNIHIHQYLTLHVNRQQSFNHFLIIKLRLMWHQLINYFEIDSKWYPINRNGIRVHTVRCVCVNVEFFLSLLERAYSLIALMRMQISNKHQFERRVWLVFIRTQSSLFAIIIAHVQNINVKFMLLFMSYSISKCKFIIL